MQLQYHNLYMMNLFYNQQAQYGPFFVPQANFPLPQAVIPLHQAESSNFEEIVKFENIEKEERLLTQQIVSEDISFHEDPTPVVPEDHPKFSIADVERIMTKFINSLHIENKSFIQELKKEYSWEPKLQELISLLYKRFNVYKTREENIKFMMRILFKRLQSDLYSEKLSHLPQKHFVKAFVIYYFNDLLADESSGFSIHNIDLLPFRKGSKVKTMNKDFIKNVMSSELFRKEFIFFSKNFDQIFSKVNKKKIAKSSVKIFKCLKNNELRKIEKLRGFPWLNKWLENAMQVANNLSDSYEKGNKKPEVTRNITTDDMFIKNEHGAVHFKRSKSIH